MKLIQSKIPFLPPDWTVARGVKYVTRLTVFILFPGLHQISIGRKIFGGLLFALYFISLFSINFHPSNYANDHLLWYPKAYELVDIAIWVSLALLAIDFKGIERRLLTKTHLVLIVSIALVSSVPFSSRHRVLNLFVEEVGNVCPAFCRYDIVEFDPAWPPKKKLAIGEYFISEDTNFKPQVGKVLANSPEHDCARGGPVFRYLPAKNNYCWEMEPGYYQMPYLVQSSWQPMNDVIIDRYISTINENGIRGVNPSRIGNLRQYYFMNDTVTDLIGSTLVKIYEWTGINLFARQEE